MAVTVTHATVATGTDAGNGEIRKAQWNEAHTVANAADVTASNVFVGNQQISGFLYQFSDTAFEPQHYISAANSTAAAAGASVIRRSRGTHASPTIVSSGDLLGSYNFYGYDGSAFLTGSLIKAEVDGTPGANDMPTRLILSTTADGASSPTERVRIDNAGRVTFGGKYVPYTFAQSGTAVSVGAVTTESTLATISFAGGELGPNGFLQVIMHWTMTNNANAKDTRVRLGGAAGTIYTSPTLTSIAGLVRFASIINSNSASSQKSASPGGNAIGIGSFSSTGVTSTVNTAAAWDLVITGQKANSGDTLTLEGYQVIVCYGA